MKKIIIAVSCVITAALFALPASVAADSAKYIKGDADGNGIVDIKDVTLIQRVISEYIVDTDGSITMRGDVTGNGLTVDDATEIQRYLAEFENIYNIGSEQDIPQPSTDFTLDEYELPFIPN